MGYDEIMNKNDMALCTVGGTTFQKKRAKCRRVWKMLQFV